jgi:hypothetical protein
LSVLCVFERKRALARGAICIHAGVWGGCRRADDFVLVMQINGEKGDKSFQHAAAGAHYRYAQPKLFYGRVIIVIFKKKG